MIKISKQSYNQFKLIEKIFKIAEEYYALEEGLDLLYCLYDNRFITEEEYSLMREI